MKNIAILALLGLVRAEQLLNIEQVKENDVEQVDD